MCAFPSPHNVILNVKKTQNVLDSGTPRRQGKLSIHIQPLVRAASSTPPSLAAPHLRVWITTASHPQRIITLSPAIQPYKLDARTVSLRRGEISPGKLLALLAKAVSSGPRGKQPPTIRGTPLAVPQAWPFSVFTRFLALWTGKSWLLVSFIDEMASDRAALCGSLMIWAAG